MKIILKKLRKMMNFSLIMKKIFIILNLVLFINIYKAESINLDTIPSKNQEKSTITIDAFDQNEQIYQNNLDINFSQDKINNDNNYDSLFNNTLVNVDNKTKTNKNYILIISCGIFLLVFVSTLLYYKNKKHK